MWVILLITLRSYYRLYRNYDSSDCQLALLAGSFEEDWLLGPI